MALLNPTEWDFMKISEWAEKILPKVMGIIRNRNQKAAEKALTEAQAYNEALDALDVAILATRKYLVRLEEGGKRNRKAEYELTMHWNETANKLWGIEDELAVLCQMKGHSWTDKRVWDKASKKAQKKMDVDSIFKQLHELRQRDSDKQKAKNRQKKKKED